MSEILACCISPVMACHTSSGYDTCVEVDCRLPGGSSMTGIARLRGRNVCPVLGQGIKRNISTAMAIDTSTGGPGVAHAGRSESGVILMTGIALDGCRDMPHPKRFPRRSGAVVTVRASADRACRVGIGCPRPGGRRSVTGIALRSRRHMTCLWFGQRPQHRNRATMAMAIRTSPRCACMRISRTCPLCCRAVAAITLRTRTDVVCRLGKSIERNKTTRMAGRAQPCRTRMIHAGWLEGREARSAMAAFAGSAGRNVTGRLGQSIQGNMGATMATRTATGNPGMAHTGRGESIEIGVAGIAETGRRNMRTRLGESLARRPVVTAVAGMIAHRYRWRQQGVILHGAHPPRRR